MPHRLQIGHVVPHVKNLVGGDVQFVAKFFQSLQLFVAIHINVIDAEHVETHLQAVPLAAGNDRYVIALFQCQRQRITVFRIILADEIPFRSDGNPAVGQHPVHIEYENPDARYIFFEVSHILRLMFL